MPPLTYGQIEALLTGMLDIHPDRVSAIGARFNTLRRLQFPKGVNVAKGRFRYDFDATFSTLILFTLIDALVLPQQAVALLRRAWKKSVGRAVRQTVANLEFEDGRIADAERPPAGPYLVLRPNALAQLRDPRGKDDGEGQPYRPMEPGELMLASPDEISDLLTTMAPDGVRPPFLMLDLHSVVLWGAQAIVSAGWATAGQLGARTRTRGR